MLLYKILLFIYKPIYWLREHDSRWLKWSLPVGGFLIVLIGFLTAAYKDRFLIIRIILSIFMFVSFSLEGLRMVVKREMPELWYTVKGDRAVAYGLFFIIGNLLLALLFVIGLVLEIFFY